MTGKDLKTINPSQNLNYLQSLRICLEDKIGRNYLFRHLAQRYCDEIVVFFKMLSKYKSTTDHHKRLLIAENIRRVCLDHEGVFAINLSHEDRKQVCF